MTVDLVFPAINLEDRHLSVTVNFISRRMANLAFKLRSGFEHGLILHAKRIGTYQMSRSTEPALHILKTKLTHPQATVWDSGIFFGKWGIIPSVDIIFAKAYFAYP